jgi:nucleoid DNA-binding protein
MQELITSYLVQKKECDLPLVGHFRIKTKPAEYDRTNQQMFPPTYEILYSEVAEKLSADLVTYVSTLQSISPDEAEAKINSWCHLTKEKLDSGNMVIFDSLGSLQKDAAENIFFRGKNAGNFYEPVSAQRVIHKNAEHPVLVGDKETTSVVMNEFYRDDPAQKKPWWAKWNVWSIVLLFISVIILVVHFYVHRFSETGIGNQSSFPAQDPPVLHRAN